LANDPARNALLTNIQGTGGKRGLRPVARREKKHSNFIDVLRKVIKSLKVSASICILVMFINLLHRNQSCNNKRRIKQRPCRRG
jgi:hypothetical protein